MNYFIKLLTNMNHVESFLIRKLQQYLLNISDEMHAAISHTDISGLLSNNLVFC
ncbi:unknown protein [Desulfotalea psychrophila LSv54]|uniref:Uncharacterized protein n=1 Tax=Desulfotalea psychrophila (strain LSv54 / DSM 12343) TaxID=177439 RepID=Q6ARS1_DESPS|nr:unknown protein [Desulfotalea psychrophila LSv54]